MKDYAFQLTDIVRETGFAIHACHGPGHLEKIHEDAMLQIKGGEVFFG